MALVGYSDSESSSDEAPPKVTTSTKSASNTKPLFSKFTDSTNPHKIKVNLPSTSLPQQRDVDDGEPVLKKAKISGGGFNAMLPAPKRPKIALASSARGKGLGSGISLKTGATPGFSREGAEAVAHPEDEQEDIGNGQEDNKEDLSTKTVNESQPLEPLKTTGSAMKFKPLSVSRKPKKKSAAALMPAVASAGVSHTTTPPPKPKASLFSNPVLEESSSHSQSGAYQPLIYTTKQTEEESENTLEPPDPLYTSDAMGSSQPRAQPQSLSTIADSLKLSASQRRQLLGRKGSNLADSNVVEFNTETEYAANEELRARGETITFNPVRSVASGKHSLQQLVNLVSNQKEALEESFAAGKRNKKEAGAKYGW